MLTDPEQILKILYRVYYGLSDRSAEFKIRWRSTIDTIFEEHADIVKEFTITRQAKYPIKSSQEFESELTNVPGDIAAEILASLKVLQNNTVEIQEYTHSEKLNSFIEKFLSNQPDGNIRSIMSEIYKKISEAVKSVENRRSIFIGSDIRILILDYFLRWSLLGLYEAGDYGLGWWFWLLQAFGITSITLLFGYLLSNHNRKLIEQLLSKYGNIRDFTLELKYSSSQYTTLAFLVGSGIFISYIVVNETSTSGASDAAGIFSAIGLILFYTLYIQRFSIGRFTETEFLKQRNSWLDFDQLTDPDINNEAIAGAENKLKSIASRLDAYVLESALLGALSFSGFLQIMANNLISFEDLEKFGRDINQLITSLILFGWNGNQDILGELATKKSLFSLVSVETLLCSLFFMMVIAARLRFSNIGDKIQYYLSIAKTYNQKEEILLEKGERDKWEKEINKVNKKIIDNLRETDGYLKRIEPINSYLQYFRNGGIIMFFLILITCSLFISGVLLWIFVAFGVFALFYFNSKSVMDLVVNWKEFLSDLMINKWYVLPGMAIALIVFGYVLRIFFSIENTDFLVASGTIILGIYFFLDIIIIPVESRDGKKVFSRHSGLRREWWPMAKWLLAIAVLIFFASFIQRIYFIGNPIISQMTASVVIGVIYLYIGFNFFSEKALGGTIGFLFIIDILGLIMGMVFPIYLVSFINVIYVILIFYVLALFKKIESPIFFRPFTIFIVLFSLLVLFGFRSKIVVGYEHYTYSSEKINSLLKLGKNTGELANRADNEPVCDFKKEIIDNKEELGEYIEIYGEKAEKSLFKRLIVNSYGFMAEKILNSEDSCDVGFGLELIKLSDSLNEISNYELGLRYVSVEGELLAKLKRKDEAIEHLEKVKGKIEDADKISELDSLIIELREGKEKLDSIN